MGRRSRGGAAEQVAGVRDVVEPYVERAVEEAGQLAERAAELALRARDEVGPLVVRVRGEVAPLVDRAAATSAELVAAAAPLVGSAVETVGGVLEESGVRGSAAWDALRGERVGPPLAVRRWPWAVAAAVAGASAGAAVAYALQRVRTADAPGAVDPEQVQAVVDRPDGLPAS